MSSWFPRVGDDVYGDMLIKMRKAKGMDIGGIYIKKGCQTMTALALIESCGERHFILAGNIMEQLFPEDILPFIGEDTEHLHIGSLMLIPGLEGENLVRLFKEAKARGIRTSFDVTYDPQGFLAR